MRFFLNYVKEIIFFLVLILIMFSAWFFISNTFLNKNLHITKKENEEVIERPVKKKEVFINNPVKKEKVVINKPVKKEKVVFNKVVKKVMRKIYREVKKSSKTNWVKRQLKNYRNGNESVFTAKN